MFYTTLPNLVLILLIACSSISTSISWKQSDFSLHINKVEPNSVNLRLFYINKNIRITSLKFNSREIAVNQENSQRIIDLEPCTTYDIEAVLQNLNTKKEFSHKESIKTGFSIPKTEIHQIIPTLNSVYVSLRYINSNCANSVEFLLNGDLFTSFDKSNFKDYIEINGLEPCSSYKIWVNTYYRRGAWSNQEGTSVSEIFSTEAVDIPPIEIIKFDNVTGLLSWEPPVSGLRCLKNYEVRLENDFGGKTTTTKIESLNLSAYPGCSNFTISIIPEGLDGKRFAKSKSINIQTGTKEPSSVMNLMGSPSSNSITISWGSPNESPECVKKYAVKYSNNSKFTDSSPYTIYDLEPCHYYIINVCNIMINDKLGNCENIGVTTTTGIPSNVNEIRTSFSNSSQTYSIYWKPPINGANCTQTYWVLVYDEINTEINNNYVYWPEIHIAAYKLKSCRNYIVSVAPVTKLNVSGSAESIIFKTQPTKPQPPTTPRLISETATSLKLQSDYKVDKDYCPLQAAIFKCQETGTSTINLRNISLSPNETQFTEIIDNLTNNTKYECSVRVVNELYQSDDSGSGVFETYEVVADPPEITSVSINHTTFTFFWNKLDPRIKLKSYFVKVVKLGKIYRTPDACEDNSQLVDDGLYQINANLLQYEITNLKPYTKYAVQMAVENSAGIGNYSEPTDVITKPYTPHQVTNFGIANLSENAIKVKWNLPCEINGQIVSMTGQLYEIDSVQSIFAFNLAVKQDELPTNYTIKYNFKSEHVYNVTIGIKLENFTGSLNQTSFTFNTNAGIPDAYNSNDWGGLVEQENPSNNITLIVSKKLFSSSKGNILNFTLLISERSCQEDPKPEQKFYTNGNDYTSLLTWYDVEDDECRRQYQLQQFVNDYAFDEIDHFLFVIGNESCNKENQNPTFCNGPLKSGTEYAVIARVFTSNGYADTQPIFFRTSRNLTTLFVIFIILSILLAGFFIGVGYMRFKVKYLNVSLSVTDITVKSFLSFYSNMEFDVIVKEYEAINTLDLRDFTTNEAKRYKEKNRYANILPYDQNRVILTPSMYCADDYINASYIDGYKRKREYIASQGPKPETSYDFWDMIIETKCHKIVMLTKLVENGITKCFQYYPDANAELWFNDIKITSIKEDDMEIFTRRELKITKGIAKRIIVQYHFQKWPDHDCPENEMDLIKFIQFFKSEKSKPHRVVVHCSAGVGRTGTLISLDMLMQQVQRDKYLNIFETVKKLRYQRVKMVQTFEQYEFLYKSVAKYIQWKWPTTKR